MAGFLQFIREQGVVGLAVGFILGGAISEVVQSFVRDILNPLLGGFVANTKSLSTAVVTIGDATISWGNFLTVLIDFFVVAMVVYAGVKLLKVEKLDSKKS